MLLKCTIGVIVIMEDGSCGVLGFEEEDGLGYDLQGRGRQNELTSEARGDCCGKRRIGPRVLIRVVVVLA